MAQRKVSLNFCLKKSLIYWVFRVSQLYETANLLYIQAIYRATPYVLGVTIGYYLQKQGNEIQEKLQKPIVAMGWIIATILAFLSVFTPIHLASRNYEYDAQEAAQYASLSPISWSLALGWLIFACHLGFGGTSRSKQKTKLIFILLRKTQRFSQQQAVGRVQPYILLRLPYSISRF